MALKSHDIERLRDLAKQVREISELPIQERNKKLWMSVNDLKMIRPVLHVRDLQISILEYEDELKPTIEDTFLQGLELDLLMRLYEWKHLRLDRVVEPIIKCNCVISDILNLCSSKLKIGKKSRSRWWSMTKRLPCEGYH